MEFDLQAVLPLLLLGLMLAFACGWAASRFDLRQWKREQQDAPKTYYHGLNLLLNEQQDKAIDAFIEAVQHDPGTSDLHFALGNLFRRRGEYERAVRVHQHLLGRGDLPASDRERAQHALAQDYVKAGLFDRAESAFRELDGTAFTTDARLELLALYERSRDWAGATDTARKLEAAGAGSFATRIAHHWCERAVEADAQRDPAQADACLAKARESAPQHPRAQILAAQRLARDGRHAEAMTIWEQVATLQPDAFVLTAKDYAASALACGQQATAEAHLGRLYERAQALELLLARLSLEPQRAARLAALETHLASHPSLAASTALLKEHDEAGSALEGLALGSVRQAVRQGALPLQRYRCAACGFEAQNYFWQCPGCHSWDSYPAQRIEEL